MNSTLRNILVVIAAIVVGAIVMSMIHYIGGWLISYPEGVDPSDPDTITANMHLFKPIHFLSVVGGHAIGTLAAAIIASKFSTSNHKYYGIGLGVFFLMGGIANAMMIPLPTWVVVIDLIFAYIPMGYLGWLIIKK